MHYSAIKRKIVKRIDKLCCQPIEVFVFHAVSDSFDPALNKQVDWSSTTEFKQRILSFKQQYTFISLDDAYRCLHRDLTRQKKLAVLTCDETSMRDSVREKFEVGDRVVEYESNRYKTQRPVAFSN